MKCVGCSVLVACLFVAISAMPSETSEGRNSVHDSLLDQAVADCSKKDSISCFKYKLYSYMDKVFAKESFSLGEGKDFGFKIFKVKF